MRIQCGTILAVAVVAVCATAGCTEKATMADFALVKGGKAVAAFEFGEMPDEKAKAAALGWVGCRSFGRGGLSREPGVVVEVC